MVIGVMVSLGLDPTKAIKRVKAMGINYVDLHLTEEYFTGQKKEELKMELDKSGMNVITVFCAHPGESGDNIAEIKENLGFRSPKLREERINRTFQLSDFVRYIGGDKVGVHVGFIPEDTESQIYEGMVDAVRRIADYCRTNDQFFSLETGLEKAKALLRFIHDVERKNVMVNFDPANLVFCGQDDPIEALEVLKDYVISVHCKDAKWPTQGSILGQETSLGLGDVGIKRFIDKLKDIDYTGPLTIEREIPGEQRWKDILEAKKLLEKLLQS